MARYTFRPDSTPATSIGFTSRASGHANADPARQHPCTFRNYPRTVYTGVEQFDLGVTSSKCDLKC